MGPQQKRFEAAFKKYVGAYAPPPDRQTAGKWLQGDKTGAAREYFKRRDAASEEFYRQMNEHIAKGVFELVDVPGSL